MVQGKHSHIKTEISILKRYIHLMFMAELFTAAKIWKQPKCPLMGSG